LETAPQKKLERIDYIFFEVECNHTKSREYFTPEHTRMARLNDSWILFHSGAADPDSTYLSTMTKLPAPMNVFGYDFPTMEHAFQAAKFYFCHGGPQNSKTAKSAVGGIYASVPALKVKSKGGKGAFREEKVTLNIAEWERYKVKVMKRIVKARLQCDPKFVNLVRQYREQGTKLLHYEQARKKWPVKKGNESPEAFRRREDALRFWGGAFKDGKKVLEQYRGVNSLGTIYEKIKLPPPQQEIGMVTSKRAPEAPSDTAQAKKKRRTGPKAGELS
jgi:predicted NAD-dependent protein-ADP-ribosyltransferase YbiA (DUF1768 family)